MLTIVHAPFVHLSLVTEWAEHRALSIRRLRAAIQMAQEIQARVMTVHAGSALSTCPRAERLERAADAYVQLRDQAGGTVLALENMADRGGVTREGIARTRDLTDFLAMVPDARFTLDVGHALQNGDPDYPELLETRPEAIANIHLHDGQLDGRAHLALGEGELALDGFLAMLRKVTYQGFLTLETIGYHDTERSWAILSAH